MKKLGTIVVALLLFSAPKKVSAQVVINELSTNTSSDWMELFVYEDTDFTGWYFIDSTSRIDDEPDGVVTKDSFVSIDVGNRLNKSGDIVTLFDGDDNEIDSISYGDKGGVCLPSDSGSIGRVDNGNTIERFATSSKGVSNEGVELDPCPTPEPTEEPTPEPTTQSTSTQEPTKTPTSTPKPTVLSKVTQKPKKTNTPKPSPSEEAKELVLSDLDESSPTPTESPEPDDGNRFPYSALLFVGGGMAFLGSAGYVFWKNQKKQYNKLSRTKSP